MPIIGIMRRLRSERSDRCALEANAASAGLALACAYSTSDEYEAEIIRIRRAAGAYGSYHWHQVYAAAGAAVVAFALAFFII